MSDERNQLGAVGESHAEHYLRKKGYEIVEKNYRCRFGEIDLIAKHKEYLVFVEVKTRKNGSKINPLISLTKKKQKKILQLGQYYLVTNKISRDQPRFDVITVLEGVEGCNKVEHIINAFTA